MVTDPKGRGEDGFPVSRLLPLRGLSVTLRFLARSRPYLFHQAALVGFLRTLLRSPPELERMLVFDALETGRTRYRSGDRYRFVVLGLARSEALLDQLIEALGQLPFSAMRTDDALPFRNNLALADCRDLFGDRQVTAARDLTTFDLDRLLSEADIWRLAPAVRLRWLAPARLLLDKTERMALKGEARFCRNGVQLDLPALQGRVHDSLAALLRARGGTPPPRGEPALLNYADADFFWVDGAYLDQHGREKPMGGLMGCATLISATGAMDIGIPADDGARELDWPALVLGQYLGIGQRRLDGFGRYRLESIDGDVTLVRPEPATSVLERVMQADNLADAFQHIRGNRQQGARFGADSDIDAAWFAEADAAEALEDAGETLERIGAALAAFSYRPPPLHGVVMSDPDGDLRPLAIPPFWDRVAQRAVVQVLGPALEPLMYDGSFGYRPGRSRHGASRMIERCRAAGFGWVFESDIDDFFDSACWDRLETRLRALFADDPVVELLLAWVTAPVTYEGALIGRHAGLPQGAPVSPLLANLLLDDFDSDLRMAGFRLVRYADDFLVLCRDREQALAASAAARASLQELGLGLNEAKTRIGHFDQGFRYLGYLFAGELALDVAGERPASPVQTKPAAPPRSWLARLGRHPARALDQEQSTSAARTGGSVASVATRDDAGLPSSDSAAARIGQLDRFGTLLLVTGAPATVRTRGGRLQVRRDDETVADLPLGTVGAVLLLGPHQITTQAMHAAFLRGVPVHFANGFGRYLGTASSGAPGPYGPELWLAQQRWLSDPDNALIAAREVVDARIRHQREALRRHDETLATAVQDAREQLAVLRRGLSGVSDLVGLNGMEGAAARAYFGALRHLVPAWMGFQVRTRRPPRDPYNALLSLGYTMLQARTATTLLVAGLHPWQGFLHQPHGRHQVLASDLMEPFRHLVERTALSFARRREQGDFINAGQQGVRLSHGALRDYLGALSRRFDARVQVDGGEPRDLMQLLHAQNLSLIGAIQGDASFSACRFR